VQRQPAPNAGNGQGRRRNRRPRVGNTVNQSVAATVAGLNFLKCAFAEPDFDTTGSMGVPDLFAGRSLGKLHAYNAPTTFAAGKDTYVFVSPIPGIAYSTIVVNNNAAITGSSVPTLYSDATSMGFPTLDGGTTISTSNVGSFRSVSLAAEVIPTVNSMTWAGNIVSARFPVRLTERFSSADKGNSFFLTGFDAINKAITAGYAGNLYTAAFNKGIYSCSLNRDSDFKFHDFVALTIPPPDAPYFQTDASFTYGLPLEAATSLPWFTGVDDLDTIVIRVSVPPGTAMTALIKTWHCVEYTPQPGSNLYEFSHISPEYDPVAMNTYKRVAGQLPTAVSCYENANFWQRVLGIALRTTSVLGKVPGAVGVIGDVANSLTRGFQAMNLGMN
jgi:hypothetical protein